MLTMKGLDDMVEYSIEDMEKLFNKSSISYEDIIDTLCDEILVFEEIGSYQGDFLILMRKGNELGFVSVGYGSCSYCDPLEDCLDSYSFENKIENLFEFRNDISSQVVWLPYDKMKDYIMNKDFKLEYYSHLIGSNESISRLKNYFS